VVDEVAIEERSFVAALLPSYVRVNRKTAKNGETTA